MTRLLQSGHLAQSLRRPPGLLVRRTSVRPESPSLNDSRKYGLVSQGGRDRGNPKADFIDAPAETKVEVIQVDLEELKRELELG